MSIRRHRHIRGRLLRLSNVVLRAMGLRLVRQRGACPARRIFPRGDFHDRLRTYACPETVSTLFDVGAYTGKTATRLGALFPRARIHAFEPSPRSCEQLRQLAEQGMLGERLVPNALALSSRSGQRPFHRHRAPQTDSLLETHPAAIEQWPDGRFDPQPGVMVRTDTLDEYCERTGIGQIDILKIDAQGADLSVLHGATNMLRRRAIGIVVVEMYFVDVYEGQGRPETIIEFLNAHHLRAGEYLAHAVDDQGRLLCVDALFTATDGRIRS